MIKFLPIFALSISALLVNEASAQYRYGPARVNTSAPFRYGGPPMPRITPSMIPRYNPGPVMYNAVRYPSPLSAAGAAGYILFYPKVVY